VESGTFVDAVLVFSTNTLDLVAVIALRLEIVGR